MAGRRNRFSFPAHSSSDLSSPDGTATDAASETSTNGGVAPAGTAAPGSQDTSIQNPPTSTGETPFFDTVSPTPDTGDTTAPVSASASSSVSAPSSDTDDTTNTTPPPPADTNSNTDTSAPPETNSDTPSPPPPAEGGTDSGASPTSWFRKLVGIAYADDSSSSTATLASTTELAVDSSTPLTDASSVEQGTPNISQPAPININTSMFQNIAVPTSTANAVLAIVYSTDGVTWQPLVDIGSSNWQQARYTIPIHSWVELQHLQIAFVGLGASISPPVYLDAAGVEVSYVDTPEATTDIVPITPATDTALTTPAPAPPQVEELPPAQALQQVFDPFAGQQCSVTPFSESIMAGGGGSFPKLTPPSESTSSLRVIFRFSGESASCSGPVPLRRLDRFIAGRRFRHDRAGRCGQRYHRNNYRNGCRAGLIQCGRRL